MEQGLAANIAQPGPQPQASGVLPSLEEVAQMLMEGVPPEELEKMGIPPELIMQAIDMLEQQMAAEGGQAPQQAQPVQQQAQQAPPQQQGGLAQQLIS